MTDFLPDIFLDLPTDQNNIVSTFNVAHALSVLKDVATGGDKDLTDLHNNVQHLLQTNQWQNPEFQTAASIWYNQKAFPGFRSEQHAAYPFDADQPQASADAINAWVAEQTQNNINKVLSSSSIDQNLLMVLLSAMYFRDTWQKPFQPLTERLDWHTDGQKINQVEGMHQHGKYTYHKSLSFDAVSLPYVHDDVVMTIYLPRDPQRSLASLRDVFLDGEEPILHHRNHQAHVTLPKFAFETRQNVLPALLKSGLLGDNEFVTRQGNLPAEVSSVLHAAKIEVDETGTVAAAVTSIALGFRAVAIPDKFAPLEFKVDRPFMFRIRRGEQTLFAGEVVQP